MQGLHAAEREPPSKGEACWHGAPGHVWWVEIEDVRMEEEAPEPEHKADPSPTEKLAKLNREATGDPDD